MLSRDYSHALQVSYAMRLCVRIAFIELQIFQMEVHWNCFSCGIYINAEKGRTRQFPSPCLLYQCTTKKRQIRFLLF